MASGILFGLPPLITSRNLSRCRGSSFGIFACAEACGTWPWQLLAVVGRLRGKPLTRPRPVGASTAVVGPSAVSEGAIVRLRGI